MFGRARQLMTFETAGALSAYDDFDQSAGNLNAKTAFIGGPWATSGAATDYAVETTGKTIQRATTGDADSRWAISGAPGFAAQVVQLDVRASVLVAGDTTASAQGAVARWIDANNRVSVHLFSSPRRLAVTKTVAGSSKVLGQVNDLPVTASTWWTIRLRIDAAGRWGVWLFPQGGYPGGTPVLVGWDGALATGGSLASGKVGIRDFWASATASTRNYDKFMAFVPVADAVCFAGQSIEFRSDDTIREDSTGTYYGMVDEYRGAPFFIPPAGDQNRTSRVAVMMRRNDPYTLPNDVVTDSQTVEVRYTPRYLYLPR